jgi:hypothetical protein
MSAAWRRRIILAVALALTLPSTSQGGCNSSTFPACLPPIASDSSMGDPAWPTQDDIDTLAGELDGSLAQPGFGDYRLYTFNARTNVPRPAVEVFPQSISDVQRAIAFAKAHGMRLSVASTGHHQDVRNMADNGLCVAALLVGRQVDATPWTALWSPLHSCRLFRPRCPAPQCKRLVCVRSHTLWRVCCCVLCAAALLGTGTSTCAT